MTATYGQSGSDLMWTYSLSGMITDTNNVVQAASLSSGSALFAGSPIAGTTGAQVSSYIATTVSSGSGIVYPTARAGISLRNGMTFVTAPYSGTPAVGTVVTDRINAGYIPGPLQGSVVITELWASSGFNQLPTGASNTPYPIRFKIADGTQEHAMILDLSCSYDADGANWAARDFGRGSIAYTLFGTTPLTNNWNFADSYV